MSRIHKLRGEKGSGTWEKAQLTLACVRSDEVVQGAAREGHTAYKTQGKVLPKAGKKPGLLVNLAKGSRDRTGMGKRGNRQSVYPQMHLRDTLLVGRAKDRLNRRRVAGRGGS